MSCIDEFNLLLHYLPVEKQKAIAEGLDVFCAIPVADRKKIFVAAMSLLSVLTLIGYESFKQIIDKELKSCAESNVINLDEHVDCK